MTLLALCFGSLLVLVLESAPGSLLHRLFTSPLLRFFGRYSYAMYLFHFPLRALLRDRLFGNGPQPLIRFPTIDKSGLPGHFLFYPVAFGMHGGRGVDQL